MTIINGIDRRKLLIGGGVLATAGILGITGSAGVGAQETGAKIDSELREKLLQDYGFVWTATSPATQLGDEFRLTLANIGLVPLKVMPRVTIMDHAAHHNERVIGEAIELAPGTSQSFSAVNEYGVANHFSSKILSASGDPAVLGIEAVLVDANGDQTAAFNQRAFMVKSWADIEAKRQAKLDGQSDDGHGHHTGVPPSSSD